MSTFTFVTGADRMIAAAALTEAGLRVRFADEREGVIPWGALRLPAEAVRVKVPRSHVIEIEMANGAVEEVPWDFARHYACAGYQFTSEASGSRGRWLLGERLRTVRARRGLSQEALAHRARVSRVSVSRIEGGTQVPRFGTLVALAAALSVELEELVGGSSD
jgi:DNA-binding XRE family transcriptional regulator